MSYQSLDAAADKEFEVRDAPSYNPSRPIQTTLNHLNMDSKDSSNMNSELSNLSPSPSPNQSNSNLHSQSPNPLSNKPQFDSTSTHHQHESNLSPLSPHHISHPHTLSSYNKLLNSHLSIYHALNNPDLDMPHNINNNSSNNRQNHNQHYHPINSNHPQHFLNKERFPSPSSPANDSHHDLSYSLSSWQSINMNTESMQDLINNHNTTKRSTISQHNTPDLSNKPSSSILSLTTSDEDELRDESMVRVTSNKTNLDKKSKVMVFETDEEDADDDYLADHDAVNRIDTNESYAVSHDEDEHDDNDDEKTLSIDLNSNNHNSMLLSNPNSFIMPKLSIADSIRKYQITILSSDNYVYHDETNDLLRDIEFTCNFTNSDVHINHIIISNKDDQIHNEKLFQKSNLIFIINDGSTVFVDKLSFTSQQILKESNDSFQHFSPKLTIINMMTVNYFTNLFELIDHFRPFQIWKTSSLKQPKLLSKLKNFINNELADDFINVDGGGGKYNKEYCKKVREQDLKKKSNTNSVYANLVSHKKTDYRNLEKQIKLEIQVSNIYDNVDPLKLSSSFLHVNILYSILKKLYSPYGSNRTLCNHKDIVKSSSASSSSTNNNLWLICSFGVGIGLGFGITSGAFTMIGFYIYDKLLLLIKSTYSLSDTYSSFSLLESNPVPATYTSPNSYSPLSSLFETAIQENFHALSHFIMNTIVDSTNSVFEVCSTQLQKIVSSQFYDSISDSFEFISNQFISLNATFLDSVKGGLGKMVTTFF